MKSIIAAFALAMGLGSQNIGSSAPRLMLSSGLEQRRQRGARYSRLSGPSQRKIRKARRQAAANGKRHAFR